MAGKKRKSLIFLMFGIDYILIMLGILGIIYKASLIQKGILPHGIRLLDFLAICVAGVVFIVFKLLLTVLYRIIGKVRTQMALYYACLASLFILGLLALGILIPVYFVQGFMIIGLMLTPYICYQMARDNEILLRKLEEKHIPEK